MIKFFKPYITEKSSLLNNEKKQKTYTFLVDNSYNKIEIKNNIASFYNVKIKKVRTIIFLSKKKKNFKKKVLLPDKIVKIKKAIVELYDNESINFFKNKI